MGLIVFFIVYTALFFLRDYLGLRKMGGSTSEDGEENQNSMEIYARKSDVNVQIAYSYLAGWLIRKNAQGSKAKLQFIRLYFQRNFNEIYAEAQTELVNAMKYNTNIRSVAKWITTYLSEGTERIKIIDFLFEIAKVDGTIIDREFVAIVRLAELIGVRASYIEKKIREFNEQRFRTYNESKSASGASIKSKHCLVLQLPENFTSEQLKRSYRKLAMKYHPDKQVELSIEEKRIAHSKFLQIQEAYEYLSAVK